MNAAHEVARVVVAVLGASFFALGCSTPDTSSINVDAGNGGGCDQTCEDADVGFALDALVSNLYNEAIAGKPAGAQSANQACPLGGTAVFSGSDGVDTSHNLTTVNLTIVMTGCEATENGDTLTFDGTISYTGSFDATTTRSVNIASDSLAYKGSVQTAQVDVVGCSAHVNDNTNQKPEVTGSMCGRAF